MENKLIYLFYGLEGLYFLCFLYFQRMKNELPNFLKHKILEIFTRQSQFLSGTSEHTLYSVFTLFQSQGFAANQEMFWPKTGGSVN